MRHAVLAFLLLVGQPAPRPAFEVVAIKRNVAVDPGFALGFQPGGRFRAVGMNVQTLIAIAYQAGTRLFPSQIVGGPAWLASDGYDITAKVGDSVAGSLTVATRAALVQSLLEDRFKLKVHRETRQVQRYALVLARQDRALGPQLRRSSANCVADPTSCETRSLPGQFISNNMTIAGLASYLASVVVRTVVIDRTGLGGTFAATLEWSPDQTAADKASIFTALQEQLGLKLEPERGPAEVVVIDRVERPTED